MSKLWILLALVAAALPALAHDVTGKWEFTVETDAGSGSPKFEFKQDGDKLTGTYTGMFGTAPLEGSVKGDRIEFTIKVDVQGQKGTFVYKGTVEGPAAMKGEVDLGLAKGTWTGKKL